MTATGSGIFSFDQQTKQSVRSQSESDSDAESDGDLDGPGEAMWAVSRDDLRDAPTLEDIQIAFATSLLSIDEQTPAVHSEDPIRRTSVFLLNTPGGFGDADSDCQSRHSSVCNLYEQSFDFKIAGSETGDSPVDSPGENDEDISMLLASADIPAHIVDGIWRKVRRDESEIQYLRSVISTYEEMCLGTMKAEHREGLKSKLNESASTPSTPVADLYGRQQAIASCIHGPLTKEEKSRAKLLRSKTTGLGSGL